MEGPRIECKGRRVRYVAEVVELPNGRRLLLDRVFFPDAVAVLPLYTGSCRIALIRQYRPVVGEWLLEAPAGVIDPGESPEEAAARELEEEAGLRPGRLLRVAEGYASPGYSTEKLYYFLALDPSETSSRPEDYEVIERVVLTPVDDALAMVSRGEIRDSKTILLVLAADRLCRGAGAGGGGAEGGRGL